MWFWKYIFRLLILSFCREHHKYHLTTEIFTYIEELDMFVVTFYRIFKMFYYFLKFVNRSIWAREPKQQPHRTSSTHVSYDFLKPMRSISLWGLFNFYYVLNFVYIQQYWYCTNQSTLRDSSFMCMTRYYSQLEAPHKRSIFVWHRDSIFLRYSDLKPHVIMFHEIGFHRVLPNTR